VAIVHVHAWDDWSSCGAMLGESCGLVGVWYLGIVFACLKMGGAGV
jgi:hypothetical protein